MIFWVSLLMMIDSGIPGKITHSSPHTADLVNVSPEVKKIKGCQ